MNTSRRQLLAAFAAFAAALPAHAQTFPARAIRLIVPAAPGGGTDIVARVLAKVMQGQGTQVFVDNKAGAGGAIGLATLAAAAPDGYTLCLTGPDPVSIMPQLQTATELGYRADRDLLPIAQVGDTHYAFAVAATLPVHSMAELVAVAKAKPGTVVFATQGNGTAGHLIAKLLELRTGAQFLSVPYKGAAPAMTALMSGEAQVLVTAPASLKAALAGGRLKPLAYAAEQRSAMLPDMPTMAESGFPDFIVPAWYGVFAPAGTPEAVATRLGELVLAAAATPEMAERLKAIGGEPHTRDRAAFGSFVAADSSLWKKVVADGKITLN